jgi:hypothetical protein
MDTATRNKLIFLNGVRRAHPELFRRATGGHRALSGLGDASTDFTDQVGSPVSVSSDVTPANDAVTAQPWWQESLNSVLSFIKDAAPAYVASQQARQCVSINADRARAGLAPLDCANSGLAPQVAVGVAPDVKYLGYAALGVLVFGVLMFSRKS